MPSLPQRLATLNARLVQKPLLALIGNPVILRHLFTLNAVLGIRTPKGLTLDTLRLGQRTCTLCDMGQPHTHGTLLYIHGGAFTLGNLRGYRHLVARLGQAAGMRAVFLNYRLAPEHPFPAGLDDAEAAWRALAADPNSGPMTLAGDSAGGNIALALLGRIIAKGLPMPAAVAALCPVTDLRLQNPSLTSNRRHDPLVSTRWGARGIAAYLNGADPAQPDASPILGDFRGAPPVLIHTDTTEVLYDDARLMAERLTAQGVDVTLTESTGLPHVWHMNVGRTPEADASVADVGAFLAEHAARATSGTHPTSASPRA
ncbi:Acetyl esterase/lipase [Loktanella atrilutea]|uniref:Acetyl esterase/lipase n=1 Tax=Loktanella atrilutea TaxID=366533 RepID=A0A1M5CDW5_LOKAT|nr:alpha/beta hydrolase [Loktanella atrilutea]SHF52915.1 Acetyl esterase/lipase [Loktanella atrilutea]